MRAEVPARRQQPAQQFAAVPEQEEVHGWQQQQPQMGWPLGQRAQQPYPAAGGPVGNVMQAFRGLSLQVTAWLRKGWLSCHCFALSTCACFDGACQMCSRFVVLFCMPVLLQWLRRAFSGCWLELGPINAVPRMPLSSPGYTTFLLANMFAMALAVSFDTAWFGAAGNCFGSGGVASQRHGAAHAESARLRSHSSARGPLREPVLGRDDAQPFRPGLPDRPGRRTHHSPCESSGLLLSDAATSSLASCAAHST